MKNAFTMRGRIRECWLWALRIDEQAGRQLVAPPIEPVTYEGFAFINVVVCRLSHLRPKPLPRLLGIGYWHVAYRVYARYRDTEGLYFLHNEADSKPVATLGKMLSHFEFQPATVILGESCIAVESAHPFTASLLPTDPGLVTGSPFKDTAQADAFLRYRPAALYVERGKVKAMRINRIEEQFQATPITSEVRQAEFLEPYHPVLERAYRLAPIDYEWQRAEAIS